MAPGQTPHQGTVRDKGLMNFKPTYWIVLASGKQLGKLMALQTLITTLKYSVFVSCNCGEFAVEACGG